MGAEGMRSIVRRDLRTANSCAGNGMSARPALPCACGMLRQRSFTPRTETAPKRVTANVAGWPTSSYGQLRTNQLTSRPIASCASGQEETRKAFCCASHCLAQAYSRRQRGVLKSLHIHTCVQCEGEGSRSVPVLCQSFLTHNFFYYFWIATCRQRDLFGAICRTGASRVQLITNGYWFWN